MKLSISLLLGAAVLVTAGANARAATRAQSKSIVIESPSTLPTLALRSAEAMYLHTTEDGRALLYVETQGGRSLSVLDVSHPGSIKVLAQVPASATGSFDFLQDVGDSEALICFRGSSQMALLNLTKAAHPVIVNLPLPQHAADVETMGRAGLLVKVSKASAPDVPSPQAYYVLDTSTFSRPILLATIPAVKQRLAKHDTGTIFLLNGDGVTVVRRPAAERDERIAEEYTH